MQMIREVPQSNQQMFTDSQIEFLPQTKAEIKPNVGILEQKMSVDQDIHKSNFSVKLKTIDIDK